MNFIEYQVEHPLIRSAWSREYESGIITICFNCIDYDIDSHSYSEKEYAFDQYNLLEFSELPKVTLDSEHILKLEVGWYNKSISHEEEQIEYVFIPIYMMLNKEMWNRHKTKVLSELPKRTNTILRNITIANEEDLPIWKREFKKLELKQKFYEN